LLDRVLHLRDKRRTYRYAVVVATTIGFRPTDEDERIIKAAIRPDERTSDVIRRALRLLEREVWLSQARSDAESLAAENLGNEDDAW
jgi:antitoxin ParD1/3/4